MGESGKGYRQALLSLGISRLPRSRRSCHLRGSDGGTPWPELTTVEDYDDGFYTTAPVGSLPKGASPYSLMDMAGNVW
jgi:hypothetical protein